MCSHRHAILHLSAKFRSNQTIVGGVMTLYPFFQDGRRQSYLGNVRPPRSAIAGLSLMLKFGIDLIYSFGDIAIVILCRWLEIAYSRLFGESLVAYFPSF